MVFSGVLNVVQLPRNVILRTNLLLLKGPVAVNGIFKENLKIPLILTDIPLDARMVLNDVQWH